MTVHGAVGKHQHAEIGGTIVCTRRDIERKLERVEETLRAPESIARAYSRGLIGSSARIFKRLATWSLECAGRKRYTNELTARAWVLGQDDASVIRNVRCTGHVGIPRDNRVA